MPDSPPDAVADKTPLGRFLVSFILVPGAIVLAGLAILVAVRWLTYPGTDPTHLVDTIEHRRGNVRWRAAVQLAGLLADGEHQELRRNRALAGRLTGILQHELASGEVRQDDVTLQVFLCRALGEFESDISLPVLVAATDATRHNVVRRAALEGIAVLADSLGAERVAAVPGLVESLLEASRDTDAPVRSTAAYALGVLGDHVAEERLLALLLDNERLVRYNAATGLARGGNGAAVAVLLEMLTPASGRTPPDQRQELIQLNALEALRQLTSNNPEVPREEIRGAVAKLDKTTNSQAVREKIAELRGL